MPPSTPNFMMVEDAAPGTSRFNGKILPVVRGQIQPDQFGLIMVPDYQRMAMFTKKAVELTDALEPDGIGFPDDIMLCIRSVKNQSSGDFTSLGGYRISLPVFDGAVLLDGHQRWNSAMTRILRGQTSHPLGVKIFMGTQLPDEVAVFFQVNNGQTPVKSDVFLRNAGTNPAIKALQDASFASILPQVSWDQQRRTGDVIKAHTLYDVALMLHGFSRKKGVQEIFDCLEALAQQIGTDRLTENVVMFFNVVQIILSDEELKRTFTWRAPMLRSLAAHFSTYEIFWSKKKPNSLFVPNPEIRRLQGIPGTTLYDLLRRNSDRPLIDALKEKTLGKRNLALRNWKD